MIIVKADRPCKLPEMDVVIVVGASQEEHWAAIKQYAANIVGELAIDATIRFVALI